jgi:hypothetical protein
LFWQDESFVEVGSYQRPKSGQAISGDVFLSEKVKHEPRIVSVLSDGLGSGVKASVLATMTATMALKFTASTMDIARSAEVIMDTLPICSVRQISYSTFTIVDVARTGQARIIEHGNPSFLLIRPGEEIKVEKMMLRPRRWRDRIIHFSNFEVRREDRILFFSDGVTQAGTGHVKTPFGWGIENAEAYARQLIREDATISARELSRRMVDKAREIDGWLAKDDITCGAVYFRSPRQLLVLTGPPFNRSHDQDLAMMAMSAPVPKVICGGTTANIIARRLRREIQNDIGQTRDPHVPPTARMEGFDLVTEGAITLGETLRLLEEGLPEQSSPNAAVRLAQMFIDSDIVRFAVGTSVNEAHQDPEFPVEFDLRRNIVKRIARVLENKYMKRTHIQYL